MDQATIDRIRSDFPAYANLLDIPEVADLLSRAAAEGWDISKLQANLYASAWWTTQSESQRNAAILYRTDPQQYNRSLEKIYTDMRLEANRLGFQIDENTLRWNATRALNEGWSAAEITKEIVAAMQRTGQFTPGTVSANVNALMAMAEQYGVGIPVEMAQRLAFEIASNQQTMEGAKQYFFNQALWTAASQGNEQLKEGLMAGYTVRDIMAPTLGLIAEELEIPVNTISLTEGIGSQIYNYKDPTTGQVRVMNQTEATSFARSQPEWKKTNRAGGVVSETVNAISQAMGVKT